MIAILTSKVKNLRHDLFSASCSLASLANHSFEKRPRKPLASGGIASAPRSRPSMKKAGSSLRSRPVKRLAPLGLC
jgi:hypothetical protein